jgi:predicted nucleic acid-binding protein
MITAVDTNILLDILIPNHAFYESSAAALQDSAARGSLVISDIVYAELCIHFESQGECDAFLDSLDIRVQALTRNVLFAASRVWRGYRQQGGKRAKVLADFLIGAHAEKQATRLLSRDRGFYQRLFPSMNLLDPSGTKHNGKE